MLLLSAKETRKEISRSVANMKVDDVAREVYKKSVGTPDSEVEKGWASGPFTEKEMTSRNGTLWLCAKRFGVEQGEKVRQIDFSEGFHNACVTMTDKVNVCGVDGIGNFIKCWAESVYMAQHDAQGKWRFRMELSNGKSLVKILHPDFRKGFKLEGKCVDLESAYKQLPVRPSRLRVR